VLRKVLWQSLLTFEPTNDKKTLKIRQIRGKTKQTLRLCALARKTK
jgi:hypothetical protein